METTLSKASQVYPDCAAMAAKLRAMTYTAEEQVRSQKKQASYLIHLAARTTPKGLHCLSMRLTAEYFSLEPKERLFPNQQNLNDPELYHYVVFSDNILACVVLVNSTVSSAVVICISLPISFSSSSYHLLFLCDSSSSFYMIMLGLCYLHIKLVEIKLSVMHKICCFYKPSCHNFV